MPTLDKNLFTSYTFNEEELKSAVTLTTSNLQHLYTLRSAYAQEKVGIKVDTQDVTAFIQREANLTGMIDVLTYLITLAEEAQEQLTKSPDDSGNSLA